LLWACVDKSANIFTMSQLAFALAFAVNHPHFLSSYMLIYSDFRKNISLENPRYFFAAVVVPLLLAGFLVYAFASGSVNFIGWSLNAMFFLVGWHYVKQVFGCVIVTSARRKVYYSYGERRVLLSNLFSLWSLSWIQGQSGSASFTFYGIVYSGLGISRALLPFAYGAVGITLVAVVLMQLFKYINQGVKPSPPGLAALGSLYVWYLPAFAHPAFAYLIPMFHSLQYLVFVWSFKKNQVADHVKDLKDVALRTAWVRDFLAYAVTAVLLGAMCFEFVPKFLDGQNFLHNPALGTSPFVAGFLLFINIHHYFIDNVIWRASNEQVKKYLFAPSGQAAETSRAPALNAA
jgi:hypothetical protein